MTIRQWFFLILLVFGFALVVRGEDKRIAATAFKILVGPFVLPGAVPTPVTGLNVANLVIDWYQPNQDSTILAKATNPTFAGSAAGWTLGAGWAYGANNLTATTASSQVTQGGVCIENHAYEVSIDVTRTAGTVTVSLGGNAGTARSTNGTFVDKLICGSTGVIAITGAGFSGTVDNVILLEAPMRITATVSSTGSVGTNDMRHVGGGIYELELTAVQTAFPGVHRIHIYDATQFAPVSQEIEIQAPASYAANIQGQLSTSIAIRDLILSDATAFPGAKINTISIGVIDVQNRMTYVSRKGVGFTWPLQFYQQANPTLPLGAGIQPTCTRGIDNLTFLPTSTQPIPTNAFGASIINLGPTDMGGDQFTWLRCTATGAIAYGWVFKIQTP